MQNIELIEPEHLLEDEPELVQLEEKNIVLDCRDDLIAKFAINKIGDCILDTSNHFVEIAKFLKVLKICVSDDFDKDLDLFRKKQKEIINCFRECNILLNNIENKHAEILKKKYFLENELGKD